MKWLNDLKEILTDSWGLFRQLLVIGGLVFIFMSPAVIYSESKGDEANLVIEGILAFAGFFLVIFCYMWFVKVEKKKGKGIWSSKK